MTIIDKSDATATLAEYTAKLSGDAVIITSDGHPVAALVPLENADIETVSLSTNRQFIELIERSRSQVKSAGGISSVEMQRRFD